MGAPSTQVQVAERGGDGASVSTARSMPRVVQDVVCIVLLALSDLFSTTVSIVLGFLIQALLSEWFHLHPLSIATWLESAGFLYLVVSGVFLFRGLYLRREPMWELIRLVAGSVVAAIAFATCLLYGMKVAEATPRSLVVLSGASLVITCPGVRFLAIQVLDRLGAWRRSVVLVESAASSESVARLIESDLGLGYKVVRNLRLEGEQEIQDITQEEVVLSTEGFPAKELSKLSSAIYKKSKYITICHPSAGALAARGTLRYLVDSGHSLVTNRNLLREKGNVLLKRLFDLILAAALSVIVFPLMGLISVLILVTSRGGVFYVQQRVGRNGAYFGCVKFRSMYKDADARLDQLLESDPAAKESWEKFHKLVDDPRITVVGRFLRRTSLDELPQFLNVLVGHMSLVGPRPLPEYHFSKIPEASRADYVDVFPGITGLWQVSGRSDSDIDQMARLNSWYVRNWSIWIDLVLLLRTVPVVVMGRGAY